MLKTLKSTESSIRLGKIGVGVVSDSKSRYDRRELNKSEIDNKVNNEVDDEVKKKD